MLKRIVAWRPWSIMAGVDQRQLLSDTGPTGSSQSGSVPRRPLWREGPVSLQDENLWLRYRVVRMRTALRFAISPEVTNILRELIADGEARLSALDDQAAAWVAVKTPANSN
jgi:hypothetical protein